MTRLEKNMLPQQIMLPREDVRRALGGVAVSTLYKMMSEGNFPRPVKVGSRSFWLSGDVENFLSRSADLRSLK